MQIVHQEQKVIIDWNIMKGVSTEKEDFSRTDKFAVFLVGGDMCDTYPVMGRTDIDALYNSNIDNDGRVHIEIKAELPVGVYSLRAVWVKNGHRNIPYNAEKRNIFAVTDNENEATNPDADKLKLGISSHVHSYGYDGLSAYESAFMYGITTALTEREYVQMRASYVDTNQIADKSITTEKIADGAITTEKIEDSNVTNSKIADNAVTEEKIADDSVTEGKIAGESVTESKIMDGSITESKIKDGAITSDKLGDKSITEEKIVEGSVTESKLGEKSVSTRTIDDNAVTNSKIADKSVDTRTLADGSVTNEKLADGAITDSKLADGSLKAYVVDVNERIDEFGERIDNEIERCEVAKENAELATDDANSSAAEAKAAKQEIEEYMKSGEYLGEVEMEIDDNGHVIVGKSFENWDINDKGHLMLSRGAGGVGMRDDYLLEQMKTILYNMNNIKSQFPDKFPPKIMYTEYEEPVVTLSYPVASYRGETISPTILYSQKRLDHYDTDVIVESIITTGAVLTWYNTDGSNTGNVTVGMSETGKEKEVKTVRVSVTLNNKSVITPFTIKQAGNPNYSDIAAAQTFEELKEEVINKFDGMQDQLDDIVGTSDTTPEIDTLKEMTKKFEGMSKDTTLKQDMALKGEVDDDEGLIIR